MKQHSKKLNFKPFGQAIKAARMEKGISRNELADKMHIAPCYIAYIENSGQRPSLQIFYELITILDVPVDALFFPDMKTGKSEQRRRLDRALDDLNDSELRFIASMVREIKKIEPDKVKRK